MTTTHKDPRAVIEQLMDAVAFMRKQVKEWEQGDAALTAGREALEQTQGEDCRIELVTTIHMLASDFENRLGRLDPDDRKIAEGDIAHARANAAKWNQNGSTHPKPVSP